MLIAFNKPYGVLSHFTTDGSPNRTLAEFGFPKNVYPIGRLDADSEGLLLLSDEPALNERLLHPRHAALYTPEGLARLAAHLNPGGIFALWSNDPPDAAFEAALAGAFATSASHVVTFDNLQGHHDASNTVYVGITADLPIEKANVAAMPSPN